MISAGNIEIIGDGTTTTTAVGDASSGAAFTEAGSGNELYFEGTTANGNEILLVAPDPETDYIVTLPAASGELLIEGGTDVAVADGGTAKSSWTQYAIPYLSNTTVFGEIAVGAAGEYLKVSAGATGYEWDTPGGGGGGDITAVGDGATGDVFTEAGTGTVLYFEGTTADAYETKVQASDVAEDVTITFGDYSGTVFATNVKKLTAGIEDTDAGELYIYGGAASIGGRIYIENGANDDADANHWVIKAEPATLDIGTEDDNTILQINRTGGIALATKLDVSEGGTGLATFTNHGVMVGSAANDLSVTAAGATGEVMIGNTTADPTWSATPTVTSITADDVYANLVQGSGASIVGTTTTEILEIDNTVIDDDEYRGQTLIVTLNEIVAQWDCIYVSKASGSCYLTDADTTPTSAGMIVMATEAGNPGETIIALKEGTVRNDAWTWDLTTATSDALYLDDATPGGMINDVGLIQDDGDVRRVVGYVLGADYIYFDPDKTYTVYTP